MRDLFLAPEAPERDAPEQLLPDLLGRPETFARLLGVDRAGSFAAAECTVPGPPVQA